MVKNKWRIKKSVLINIKENLWAQLDRKNLNKKGRRWLQGYSVQSKEKGVIKEVH
jgi:hypothetical protein